MGTLSAPAPVPLMRSLTGPVCSQLLTETANHTNTSVPGQQRRLTLPAEPSAITLKADIRVRYTTCRNGRVSDLRRH